MCQNHNLKFTPTHKDEENYSKSFCSIYLLNYFRFYFNWHFEVLLHNDGAEKLSVFVCSKEIVSHGGNNLRPGEISLALSGFLILKFCILPWKVSTNQEGTLLKW